MDFIAANYAWFIIGLIVILMAIVGYFAEKTDFGRKQFDKTDENNKPKEKINIIDLPNARFDASGKVIQEDLAEESKENIINTNQEQVETVDVPEELMVPIDAVNETVTIEPVQTSELEAPLEVETITTDEVVYETEKADSNNLEETMVIPDELAVPFGDVEEAENIYEKNDNIENPAVSNEEEDLWKF